MFQPLRTVDVGCPSFEENMDRDVTRAFQSKLGWKKLQNTSIPWLDHRILLSTSVNWSLFVEAEVIFSDPVSNIRWKAVFGPPLRTSGPKNIWAKQSFRFCQDVVEMMPRWCLLSGNLTSHMQNTSMFFGMWSFRITIYKRIRFPYVGKPEGTLSFQSLRLSRMINMFPPMTQWGFPLVVWFKKLSYLETSNRKILTYVQL